jgi:beta-galactosidase
MTNKEIRTAFWYGTHYYRPPTPTEAEWETDFRKLADLGLKNIQARVFWRWYERSRGVYRWNDLDRFMDLADQHGLKVVHQIFVENGPQYVFDEYDGFRVDIRGQRIWPIAGAAFYPGGWIPCFDNPDVMKACLEFVRALVDRYRRHPALAFWHAWNEPRSRPMGECACNHSIQSYRRWLAERFKTIDALNDRFGKCWPGFDEIDAARDTSDFAEMFLWRQWSASRVKARVRAVVDAVRETDADHAVISHVGLNSMQQDPLFDISDDEQMADAADLYGSSFEVRYIPEPLNRSIPFMICDWMRHVGRGEYSIYELYPSRGRFEREITPAEFQQWLWTPVSAGAKGVFLWQYKKERLGLEINEAGLVEIDGSDNPTSLDARKSFALLHSMKDTISTWRVPAAQVAIVYDLQSDLVNRLELTTSRDGDYVGRYDMKWQLTANSAYKTALQGIYHLFWLKNIRTDVVSSARLAEVLGQYELLYWPAGLVIDRERSDLLAQFLDRGGKLIVDAGFARRDANTWLHPARPGAGFIDRWGYREGECLIDPKLRRTFDYNGRRLTAAYECIKFQPASAAVSAAWTDDAAPAMVSAAAGRGKILALGFSPGISYLVHPDPAWPDFVEQLVVDWAKMHHLRWYESNSDVTLRRLEGPGGQQILFVYHRGNDAAWKSFTVPGAESVFELSHVKCLALKERRQPTTNR